MRLAGKLRKVLAVGVVAASVVALSACGQTADASSKLPPQASGPLSASVTKSLDETLEAAMKRSGSSGAIAGVWAPWAGSWTVAKGTTGPKDSTPMSTSMSFRIGSETKSMTCTVLLALVDKGTVALDDPVSKYLPRMVGLGSATLGQLCHNTSGFGDYWPSLVSQFVNNPTRQWAPMELVSDGLAEPVVGEPGAKFGYSNTGFVLLGVALEAATGQSWNDLYQQYVWGPLGLDHTALPDPEKVKMPSPAAGGTSAASNSAGFLQCGTSVDESEASSSMGWTAGGVVSTLDDLKTYAQALATGTLLSSKSAKEQWSTVAVSSSAPSWQGYGMGASTLGPMRGSSGWMPGYISTMMSDPKTGLTVVVMLNNSTVGIDYAQLLGMQLASIASKAPAKSGKAPAIALPWSQEQAAGAMASNPTCPPEGVKPGAPVPGFVVPQAGN